MRIKSDEAAIFPRIGHGFQEPSVTVPDFHNRWSCGQAGKQLTAESLQEPCPMTATVEHPVWMIAVWDLLVVKCFVENVPAIEATNEAQREFGHTPRLVLRLRPAKSGQRELAAIVKRNGNVEATSRASGRPQIRALDIGRTIAAILL